MKLSLKDKYNPLVIIQ